MKQKDIFEDQLKALFSDYEAPLPEDGWAKLEESLNSAGRIKIIRRNWYIGAAAAVAAILITGILFLQTPTDISHTKSEMLVESTSDMLQPDEDKTITADSKKSIAADPIVASNEIKVQTVTEKTSVTPISKVSKIENIETDSNDKLLVSNQLTQRESDTSIISEIKSKSSESKQKNEEVQLSREEIDRLIMEFANAGNINIFEDEALLSKTEAPVMLALGGKGGLLASQTVANSPMTLRSASASVGDDYVEEEFFGSFAQSPVFNAENPTALTNNIADNISEMDHAQPVSAGITVSKSFFDSRFSVETGLVYTYLHSKAKNSSINYISKETQDFHYLGIPVNFNYNFLSFGNLDLFSTIGGMIEKDIYGEYKISGQSDYKNLDGVSEGALVQKIKQKNFQYSVNAGFGASYPIYRNLNFYAKFGGSYYFDAKNHQYKTIYSDRKIMLDLNAGIRFDF